MGAQKNRLIETVLLCTHNVCFGWEIRKLFFLLKAWNLLNDFSISPGNIWTPLWEYHANLSDNPEKMIKDGQNNQVSLTLKAPITTKVVCFCRLLNCFRSLSNKQCRLRSDCSLRAVWSGSTLFVSIHSFVKYVNKYLQMEFSDDFFWRFKG